MKSSKSYKIKTKKRKSDVVNEPQSSYQGEDPAKTIHFFSSFEEMENDNYKWLASLTPQEHLQYATEHIKRIFADDLKKNPHIGFNLIIN